MQQAGPGGWEEKDIIWYLLGNWNWSEVPSQVKRPQKRKSQSIREKKAVRKRVKESSTLEMSRHLKKTFLKTLKI